jgi:hypothetical protein
MEMGIYSTRHKIWQEQEKLLKQYSQNGSEKKMNGCFYLEGNHGCL